MGATVMKEYKVGEAPWEKEEFEVGKAPWENDQKEDPSIGSQALDYGLRALDYAGGITRTGIAQLADLATEKELVQEGDWEKAIKGKAPDTEQFLDRSGMQDSIGRTALGFVGDIALDPTTYLSGGATALPKLTKLQKLMSPAAKLADVAGNKMIRSGVSKIDETLELAGKGKLSDIMIEEGIVGTNKHIKKKLNTLGNRFAKERKEIYSAVDNAGGVVDPGKIIDDFTKYTSKMRAKTGNAIGDEIAESLETQLLKALPESGAMTMQQASNIKTQIRKALPENFYGPFGNVKDEYKKGVDKLSNIFQKNIENVAEDAIPGMGKEIAEKNKKWSVLLDADSPLGREARNASGKNYITSVDAMVGAGSFVGAGRKGAGTMLVAKKLADAAKTTGVRTVAGKELKRIGKTIDPMVRRGLINFNREREK